MHFALLAGSLVSHDVFVCGLGRWLVTRDLRCCALRLAALIGWIGMASYPLNLHARALLFMIGHSWGGGTGDGARMSARQTLEACALDASMYACACMRTLSTV